jgi:hypothetical protein
MRFPRGYYGIYDDIAQHFSEMRPAQQRGLALWVYGTLLAKSACQNAVISALLVVGKWWNLRQYLREWLWDGKDKAAACNCQLEISTCFAPLLAWLLAWWQGENLALAVDATTLADRLVLLVVSVLYRGCAIPVAWQVLPGNVEGPWMPHILALLQRLAGAVPAGKEVIVLADRGLCSPRLWQQILSLGWHALMRVQKDTIFQPQGCPPRRAWQLVGKSGQAWVGRGVAFRDLPRRQVATCVVVWQEGELEPWVLLSDLPPSQVGVLWYGLRVWTELGFRVIKSIGWQWQRTRRLRSERVARHWLVLAVATLYTLAYGTRDEDSELAGIAPENLRTAPSEFPPKPDSKPYRRQVSLFRRGLGRVCWQLCHSRPWRRLWLLPEPWPLPPLALHIAYHDSS